LSIEHTQADMAKAMGVHRSTICRELRRNRGQRGYHAKQAHEKALSRRRGKSKLRMGTEMWSLVEQRPHQTLSLERIAGRLALGSMSISHERICQRQCQGACRTRGDRYRRRSRNLKTVSAEEENVTMDTLRLCPRKRLGFGTPYEKFFGHPPVAATR